MNSDSSIGKADLHMHTNLGDGTASPERVVEQAVEHNLNVIAITDHDHIDGAKRVADILHKRELDIDLIVGSEVTSRDGHILALFIQRPLPFLKSAEATIEAIKEQGGICIIPHPLGKLVPSLSRRKIESLIEKGYPIDGIEIFNPSPANRSVRDAVIGLNKSWGFAETGSSDAHFWQQIGSGYTLFAGKTAEGFRQALLSNSTKAGGQELPHVKLPVTSLIGQCAWSWFVDPPRKIMRRMKN